MNGVNGVDRVNGVEWNRWNRIEWNGIDECGMSDFE